MKTFLEYLEMQAPMWQGQLASPKLTKSKDEIEQAAYKMREADFAVDQLQSIIDGNDPEGVYSSYYQGWTKADMIALLNRLKQYRPQSIQ
jgi:hypothetical protein